MAAATTYDLISTTTVPTSTASFQLTSFGGYTDLVLVIDAVAASGGATDIQLRFNNNTSALYNRTGAYSVGTSQASFRSNDQTRTYLGQVSSTARSYIIANIMNYTNTQMDKSILSYCSAPDAANVWQVNVWRSTDAVTTLDFSLDGGGNIGAGSNFYLYGIKEA
jgi:hypothetical protein